MTVKVDLTSLDAGPAVFRQELLVPEERLDADVVVGPVEVRLDVVVHRRAVGFEVTGTMELRGNLRCARCLSPVAWDSHEDVMLTLLPAPSAPGPEETALSREELDVEFLTSEELDLEAWAAQQVLLTLPMRVVCSPECAGLCPVCGANRNIAGACRCEPEGDPRWDALRSLRTEIS